MSDEDKQIWTAVLSAIPSVEVWNANLDELKRLAAEYGPECKAYIAAEAQRRGYLWDGVSKAYRVPWKMYALKGRNVIAAGWNNGVLRVAFAGKEGARFWRYEGVPEAEFVKLRSVPFPDRIFHSNIKSKGYKATAE